MMIYKIGAGGHLAERKEISGAVIPDGWTRTPPPDLADGEYAVWGVDRWHVSTQPYVPWTAPAPEPEPSPFAVIAESLRDLAARWAAEGKRDDAEDIERVAEAAEAVAEQQGGGR